MTNNSNVVNYNNNNRGIFVIVIFMIQMEK